MAKKKGRGIIILLIIILLVAAGGIAYTVYSSAMNDINGKNQEDKEYTLVIGQNDFEYEIGQKLNDNGVVLSDVLWTNWMASKYPDFVYINGEYSLNANMSYEEIASKLQSPDISHQTVKVAIPEGFNVMDIAERLEENGVCSAEDFLNVCKSTDGFDYKWLSDIPDNELIAFKLEGFLFPATYDFAMNSDAHKVADVMLSTFDEHITDKMNAFCKEHNMSLYELITLASIVQEEAFTNESAYNIASVFMNRLEAGDKLQSDVTYFYARDLEEKQGFSQEVFDAYYTYTCPALPIGPITNSGEAVIKATIDYPDTGYYYFFSDLNQEFHFASTYEEFEKLKSEYPWE